MTHQQKLENILVANNEPAISPFLKSLTKEERKALGPAIKKCCSYYFKVVEIKEGTWKRRATDAQFNILEIACYVCLNYKDFRKHTGWFNGKMFDAVMEYYIPEWLDNFVNSHVGENWMPHEMSYMWI